MAIRNINAINNSVDAINNANKLEVEVAKQKINCYYNNIMEKSCDVVDVIDTYNYCVSKGVGKKLDEFTRGSNCKPYIYNSNTIRMSCADSRSCWVISTNGTDVSILVSSTKETPIPTIVKRLYYDKSSERVIAPMPLSDYSLAYDANDFKEAIRIFAERLPLFINNFFDAVDNLAND